MRGELSPSEKTMLESVRRFARERIEPVAAEIDRTAAFPAETVGRMAELGVFGLLIPEAYGGVFTSHLLYYSVVRELAGHCASHALTLLSHCLCAHLVATFGSEEQKRAHLPRLASGETLGAVCMTEPEAGSDLAAIRTFAQERDNVYVVQGGKHFITNGGRADLLVVLACVSRQKTPFNQSLFLMEKSTEGVRIGRCEMKMGCRGADTRELFFDEVEVPAANLLGRKGQGMLQIAHAMETSRTAVASLSLGLAERAFRHARDYSKQRKQFGQTIGSFDAIRFYLAETATDMECARLLIQEAAELQRKGKRIVRQSSMAKLFATEMAFKAASRALQIHGGYGYMQSFPLERIFRDARLFTIVEGTNEIQRKIIAGHL